MLFNSLSFLVFFAVVTPVYFILPHRLRWFLLLTASYFFYMSWEVKYALLILAVTVINYFSALQISKVRNQNTKKIILGLACGLSLSLLFVFKYFNFFSDSVRAFAEYFTLSFHTPALDLLLPVGISFFTFQAMGYTIDVYRGTINT
jgi:alginate O-acetyltransferase complex protein AlgI